MTMDLLHEAKNNALFSRYAPIYNLVTLPLFALRHRVTTLAQATAGKTILDVACGTGTQSLQLAATGAHVTGIDLSPQMLRKAKTKRNGCNPTFILGDATKLPFPNASFDVALITFALHDMPEDMALRTLREIRRAVMHSGRILIVDYHAPRSTIGKCIHKTMEKFESEHYQSFMKRGLDWYMQKSALTIQKRELHLFGAAQLLVIANSDSPQSEG